MSLISSGHTGGAGGTERAPRLEGAADYASWRPRISAHLQARGAQDAHKRVLTAHDYARKRAQLDAWDAEEDARSDALAAAALPMKAEPPQMKADEERRLADQVAAAMDARKHVRAQMQRSAMAFGVLFAALPDSLQLQTRHVAEGHAYGLWSWLEAKFQNTDRDNVGALWQEWTALQQDTEQSFDAHYARWAQAQSLLAHAKQHVSSEQQLHVLIDRLRPEYKLAVLALKNGALIKDVKPVKRMVEIEESPFDFNAIGSFINAHERAEQRADATAGNEVAAAAMRQRGGQQQQQQQQRSSNGAAGEREPPWMTEPCWTCGKVGHPARRCKQGSAKAQKGKERSTRGSSNDAPAADRNDTDDDIAACCALVGSLPGDDGHSSYETDSGSEADDEQESAYAATSEQAPAKFKRLRRMADASEPKGAAAASAKPASEETKPRIVALTKPSKPVHASVGAGKQHWLRGGTGPSLGMDTMCSIHCNNNKKLFTGKLRNVAPVRVKVANGEIIEVSQVGTLKLSVHASRKTSDGTVVTLKKGFRVDDVYYHPTFATTLISWGKLFEDGWKLVSSKQGGSAVVSPAGWRINLGFSGRLMMLATDNAETVMVAAPGGPCVQGAMAVEVIGEPCRLRGRGEITHDSDEAAAPESTGALMREHVRLGHMAADALIKLVKSRAVDGLPELSQKQLTDGRQAVLNCVACIEGKMTRSDFGHGGIRRGSAPCEVLHFDTFEKRIHRGNGIILPEYYLCGIDDWGKYRWQAVVNLKSNLPDALLTILRRARTEFGTRIKVLHADGGSEFINGVVEAYLSQEGIELIHPPPATQQLNGVAERNVDTVKSKALAMMRECGLPDKFHRHAVEYATTLLNCTTVSANTGVTPEELRTGVKVSLKHFAAFGSDVFYHIPRRDRQDATDARAAPAVYLGTNLSRMGSPLWCLKSGKLKVRRDLRYIRPVRFSFAHRLQGGQSAEAALAGDELEPTNGDGSEESRSARTSSPQGGMERLGRAEAGAESKESESDSESDKDEQWAVKRITRHRGDGAGREFLVHWDGHKPSGAPWEPSWQREANVAESKALDTYLRSKGMLTDSDDDDDGRVSDAQVQAVMFSMLVDDDAVDGDALVALLDGAQLEAGAQTPTTYAEAMRSRERAQWQAAMDKEMEALIRKGTWTEMDRAELQRGTNVLPVKWVYKLKTRADGSIEKFKARNTPKGFKQKAGIDFFETYAHTGSYKAFRLLLSLAALWDYELVAMDVPEAFLNATLPEDVYVELPLGYGANTGKVGKLNKALYGIKQGPRRWDETVHPVIVNECGWTATVSDRSLYIRRSRTGLLMLLFRFVDDFKGASHKRDEAEMEETIQVLRERFGIQVRYDADQFLGMRITRDRAARTIKLDLGKYITEALARYGLAECKVADTPEVVNGPLTKETKETDALCDKQAFMEMTGTLMYAAYACRADIAHAAYALASHMQAPTEAHLVAAKRVLRYLAGTKEVGPVFGLSAQGSSGGSSRHLVDLCAYADADWANDKRDRKSISGWATKLNGDLISWSSKKQSVVSLSTCEAEIYATGAAIQEVLWLQGMLSELGLRWQPDGATVYGDNQSAIAVAKNGIKSSSALKHVALKWSFISEAVENKDVQAKWIATTDQQADIFTKALSLLPFKKLREQLLGC